MDRIARMLSAILSPVLRLIFATLIPFAPLGLLETFNHFRGGDEYRPWVLDENAMARLKAREMLMQNYEQEQAMAERMEAIARSMEPAAPRPKKERR